MSARFTPMPHTFPGYGQSDLFAYFLHELQIRWKWWGGPPGPRGTPSSRFRNNGGITRFALLLVVPALFAQPPVRFDSGTVSGLPARNIGSASMSGRIAALAAVNDRSEEHTSELQSLR